jgi:hypothetical protein
MSLADELEAKYNAAAKARGTTAWTPEEYAEIFAARQVEHDAAREARNQEDVEVLKAFGLLHPDMTPFEIKVYKLAISIWDNPTLKAAVKAEAGPLEIFPNGSQDYYTAEEYAYVFNQLPPAEQKRVREAIVAQPGWQRWAASKA